MLKAELKKENERLIAHVDADRLLIHQLRADVSQLNAENQKLREKPKSAAPKSITTAKPDPQIAKLSKENQKLRTQLRNGKPDPRIVELSKENQKLRSELQVERDFRNRQGRGRV